MARILIATYSMYGSWFSLQLEEEGHSVDIWLMDHFNDYSLVLDGIIKPPSKARPNFTNYDLVMFDLTGRPKIAEEVLNLGVPCIGDGDLHSELEDNRLLGIQIMEECGIGVPFYESFNDIGTAKRFVKKTNKTYVFKPNGGQDQETASTYVSKSPEDLLAYLDKLSGLSKGVEFILQEVVSGTEISTEGWFNGEDFFLINGTLEEKKFMNEGKGPNTGCSGNLVWLYDQTNKPFIFREGLEKMKGFLQEYDFRGMIDLNTIVTDSRLYGLEWTPRFGYDASATLYTCFNGLGDFLGECASGGSPSVDIINTYAAGVRLSIPPYPSEIRGKHPEEVPIEGLEEDEIIKTTFLYDCMCDGSDGYMSCGVNGLVAVPMGNGGTIQEAFGKVHHKIKNIHIPDMQFRTDIEKSTTDRYRILDGMGWLR
jgi:phosphoribosylamine-glycine ligase